MDKKRKSQLRKKLRRENRKYDEDFIQQNENSKKRKFAKSFWHFKQKIQ